MVLPPELARIHALVAAEGTLHHEIEKSCLRDTFHMF